MSAKAAIFVLCAQALVIQSALSQVCGRATYAAAPGLAVPAYGYDGVPPGWAGNGLACNGLAGKNFAFNGLSAGLAGNSLYAPAIEIAPTTGGALPVTSASAIAPNSIVVESENVFEGPLSVAGELPFVGTVGLEGVIPTAGTGAVNYACGNGATKMVSQEGAVVTSGLGSGFAPAAALAPGNRYGGIGAFGNAVTAAPFGCGAGLAGLANPAAGLAGAYPTAGLAGAFPAAGYGAGPAPYGGTGEGNVAVTGELPVAGNTAVAGQVPIMGAVSFSGGVPAAGAVSISGNCACGCGSPYVY